MTTFANNNIIQAHWLENKLVGINSLLYNSGIVTLLNVYTVSSEKEKKQFAFPIADTTIDSLQRYNEDIWTEIQPHPNFLTVDNLRIYYGEGGMGNEGFVAATDATGLVWALFSTESNPFIKMKIDNRVLFAYSDLFLYKINFDMLTDIEVITLIS